MGNCHPSCFKDQDQIRQSSSTNRGVGTHTDSELLNRYTKITIENALQDEEEGFYLKMIDSEQIMQFFVHVNSLRLTNFVSYQGQLMFLGTEIGEDKIISSRNKHRSKAIMNATDSKRMTSSMISELDRENQTKWSSSEFLLDDDCSYYIPCDLHFKYEGVFKDLQKQCFILEFNCLQQSKKPVAFVVIDFLALAIGPKKCDLEVKDFRTCKPIGRITTDIHIKQVQSMEIKLNELSIRMNGKEERPVFGQFRVISSNDNPKLSETTPTKIGRFKKETNLTYLDYKGPDSYYNPSIVFEASLESLKNSTIQLLSKIDWEFSERQSILVKKRVKLANSRQRFNKTIARKEDAIDGRAISFAGGERTATMSQKRLPKQGIIEEEDEENEEMQEKDLNRETIDMQNSTYSFDMTKMGASDISINQLRMSVDLHNTGGMNQSQNKLKEKLQDLEGSDLVSGIEKEEKRHKRRRSSSLQDDSRVSRSSKLMFDAMSYYKHYEEDKLEPAGVINFVDNLIGECYIGFSKLIQSELRSYEHRDQQILQNKMSLSLKVKNSQSMNIRNQNSESILLQASRNGTVNETFNKPAPEMKTFYEQLWLMGKVVGKIKGNFILSNLPLLQQMSLGVLSENGIIMNSAPILIDEKNFQMMGFAKKSQKNERITVLIDLTKKLKRIDEQKTKKIVQKFHNEKVKILNDIITILAEYDKILQVNMFQYSDEIDLLRAQQTMIELAFHCLLFAETVRYDYKRDYYEILSQIFMRDELKLTNLALSEQEHDIQLQSKAVGGVTNSSIKGKKHLSQMSAVDLSDPDTFEKILKEKTKIAQFYQKLLYQTLDDCLNKFNRKDVEPYLKSYLEIVISLAFFRVPKFQHIFLGCINNDDVLITEWRGLNWNLDNDSSNITELGIMKLFDWDLHFLKHIPQSPETLDAQRLLRRIESNKKWQSRLKKRSIAFFQIVKRWCEIIADTVQSQHIFWQDIPGYKILVKAVLQEMKIRNVADYPDSLINASVALIQNSKLLTVFVAVVFQKTNVFDSNSVCTAMGLVTKWINHIESLGLPFPSNFDFSFFLKGLQIALNFEHSVSTPRTIYLLYKTLHFYPIDMRTQIVQLIFQKYFYRLFFSWSYNIRDVFISLLLYQIEFCYIVKTTTSLGNDGGIGGDTNLSQKKRNLHGLRDQAKISRMESLRNAEATVQLFEQQMQQNPNEAEEQFDRSISRTKLRLTADFTLSQNRIAKNSSTNLESSRNFDGTQGQTLKKQISQTSQFQTFIKAHNMLRQKLNEIELIDEHHSRDEKIKQSHRMLINQSSLRGPGTMREEEKGPEEAKESKYDRVLKLIPEDLKVYAPQAVNDFFRQVQEFEDWKQKRETLGTDILLQLPEFNMEKNMPVEDDNNLETKDEW